MTPKENEEYVLNPPSIELEDIVWNEVGSEHDPKNVLHSTIRVGPLRMHLQAYQVRENEDGIKRTVNMHFDYDVGTLEALNDCSFTTLDIDGRTYVLVATPYGK